MNKNSGRFKFTVAGKKVFLASVLLACAGVANAQGTGWYAGFSGSYIQREDSDNAFFQPAGEDTSLLEIDNILILLPSDGEPPDFSAFTIVFEDGYGLSGAIGYDFGAVVRAELELRQEEVDVESFNTRNQMVIAKGDSRGRFVLANVWFDVFKWGQNNNWQSYAGFGVGGYEAKLGGVKDDVFAAQVGIGVSYHPTSRWTIETGYRYLETEDPEYDLEPPRFLKSEYASQSLTFGLRYNFFEDTNVATNTRHVVRDTDGDGVNDDRDQCPNTPHGMKVDSVGCKDASDTDGDGVEDFRDQCPNTPIGTRVDGYGCAIRIATDTDGDGVLDSRDQCPNTPLGTRVDSVGCAIRAAVTDRDRDGIFSDVDQCPNTPRGRPVLSNGCGKDQSLVLKDVNFEFGSNRLTVNAKRILDTVADSLKQQPGFRIVLSGHTDSVGPAGYNQTLSELRAEAVRQYLISKGIDDSRLEADGWGESRPLLAEETEFARAKNRRVELKVLSDGR